MRASASKFVFQLPICPTVAGRMQVRYSTPLSAICLHTVMVFRSASIRGDLFSYFVSHFHPTFFPYAKYMFMTSHFSVCAFIYICHNLKLSTKKKLTHLEKISYQRQATVSHSQIICYNLAQSSIKTHTTYHLLRRSDSGVSNYEVTK